MMIHSAPCLLVCYVNMKPPTNHTDQSAGSSTWLRGFCQLGLSSSTGSYIFLLVNASKSGCCGKHVVEEVRRRVREGNLTCPECEGCVTLQVSYTRKTRGPVAPLVRVAWAERPRFMSSHSVTPSVRGKHALNSRRVDHLSEFAACGDGSIITDDRGTAPLGPSESRDILEIIDDRSQLSSTIIAGQLPVEDWHRSTGVESILRPSGLGSLTYLSCPDALLSSPV